MISIVAKFLKKLLVKSERQTGIYASLTGILLLGIAMATTGNPLVSAGTAFIGFAIAGLLELSYKNTARENSRMNQVPDDGKLIYHISKHKETWQLQAIEQFTYCGLIWKTIGFDKLSIPLAITGPFCPACGHKMAYRAGHRYAILPAYILHCHCTGSREGTIRLPRPLSQIRQEVLQLKNIPK